MNLDQSLATIHAAPILKANASHKLPELWIKVKPMVVMLGLIFGRKVKPYINAFIAAIDELVAEEEGADEGADHDGQ